MRIASKHRRTFRSDPCCNYQVPYLQAIFRRTEDGILSYANEYDLPGDVARDFMISDDGRIVVIAMQFSDTIDIYEIDGENASLRLTQSDLEIPSPAAVVIRKEEN